MSESLALIPRRHGSNGRPALIGWLAALATVMIWAVWAVATRHAVTHDLPPAAIGLLRFGVPACCWRRSVWRRPAAVSRQGPGASERRSGSSAPARRSSSSSRSGCSYAPAAEIGPLLPGTMPLFVALIGWLVLRRAARACVGCSASRSSCSASSASAGYGLLFVGNGAWRGHLLLLCRRLPLGDLHPCLSAQRINRRFRRRRSSGCGRC